MSKQSKKEIGWKREAVLIGCITGLLLLFISNFGVGGAVGDYISSTFFGIFGLVSYVLPLIVGFLILFLVSNNDNKIAKVKGISAIVLILLICAFVELVFHGNEVPTFKEAYFFGYDSHLGGGIIGWLYTKALVPNIALIASFIVDIAAILICLILITEKALFSIFGQRGKKAMAMQKEHYELNQEKRVVRKVERQEEKKRRMDMKATGVATDTKLKPTSRKSKDEMSELKPTKIKHSGRGTKANTNYAIDKQFEEPKNQDMVIHGMANLKTGNEMVNSLNPSMEEHTISPITVSKAEGNGQDVSREDIEREMEDTKKQLQNQNVMDDNYEFPPINLLMQGSRKKKGDSEEHLRRTAKKLEETLDNFGVNVKITDISCGPSVTRYELQPEMGVKVSKIVSLSDDIKLNLAASDIRIEAPIPGKAAVGIEVPNKENITVMFRELVDSKEFETAKSKISFAVGKDIGGKTIVSNIAKMPHLLIAGATGSGKSVFINTIIMSILYKARPDEVKLIMIDPKVVELSVYNGIPHLMIPVVTDPKKAAGALNWAVAEMTNRYQKFAECNVRDLSGYNDKITQLKKLGEAEGDENMPQIVIIVDELADLMMVASKEVEDAICRLAQLARAAGIHLIIATQRPSVNVITGVIKANMPSRVAFSVSSGVDSRTILDSNGAEKLLGKGDMLFYPQGYQKPLRVQGAFITDEEVFKVVAFLKRRNQVSYNHAIEEHLKQQATGNGPTAINGSPTVYDSERDLYFAEAGRFLIEKERGSIGMLQRVFKVGFNRAARIMDQLEEAGVVGPEEGTKPRKILVTIKEFEEIIEQL